MFCGRPGRPYKIANRSTVDSEHRGPALGRVYSERRGNDRIRAPSQELYASCVSLAVL